MTKTPASDVLARPAMPFVRTEFCSSCLLAPAAAVFLCLGNLCSIVKHANCVQKAVQIVGWLPHRVCYFCLVRISVSEPDLRESTTGVCLLDPDLRL